MTHGQSAISGEARNREEFFQEMSVNDLFSVGVDSHELCVRPKWILRNLYHQKNCQPEFRGTERVRNKGKMALRTKPQVQRLAGLPHYHGPRGPRPRDSGQSPPDSKGQSHLCGLRVGSRC